MNKQTYEVMSDDDFIEYAVNRLCDIAYKDNVKAGWWTKDVLENPMMFSLKLMQIVGECAEAQEGDRKNLMDSKLPHRLNAEVELSDVGLRLFDLARAMNFNLGSAMREKRIYNMSRVDHSPEARASTNGKKY